jgi:hypothetical protein
MAYQDGRLRTTALSQVQAGDGITVTIAGASGWYSGALSSRDNVLTLVTRRAGDVSEVTLRGVATYTLPLPRHETQAAFDAASRGWYRAEDQVILAKSGIADVNLAKRFEFWFDNTVRLPFLYNPRTSNVQASSAAGF